MYPPPHLPIVQALPATNALAAGAIAVPRSTTAELSDLLIVLALPAAPLAVVPSPPLAVAPMSPRPARPSPCTRSRAIPEWTAAETLVLVGQIAALDERWLKELSSYQRWAEIADHCASAGVPRPSGQCKRRWEALVEDYGRIRDWEARRGRGEGAFLRLGLERRRRLGVSALVDDEVFEVMGALVGEVARPVGRMQEAQPMVSESEDDEEEEEEEESNGGGGDSEEGRGMCDAEMVDARDGSSMFELYIHMLIFGH